MKGIFYLRLPATFVLSTRHQNEDIRAKRLGYFPIMAGFRLDDISYVIFVPNGRLSRWLRNETRQTLPVQNKSLHLRGVQSVYVI